MMTLALSGWAVLRCVEFVVVGLPMTPMSIERADRLFKTGLHPGQSRDEVEAWLLRQGIPSESETPVHYDILNRHDDVTFAGWWMDCRGNQTVAEIAGLDVDSVYSFIRVWYPDADRFFLGHTEIRVYLFFGADGRMQRHWVDECHIGP